MKIDEIVNFPIQLVHVETTKIIAEKKNQKLRKILILQQIQTE